MAGGASAADVRSILSLPDLAPTAGPSKPRKSSSTTVRKLEGIPRELQALLGSSTPTLAVQLAKPQLKQKPNLGSRRVKWEWRPFRNSARSDSLSLCHWVKADTDAAEEYPFVKYNVPSTVYTYSQDEYTRLLEDKEWSKEETDYLFNLAKDFDVRWYIVSDRYDFPGGVARSIDDLKDRYYSVCRRLVRNRPWAGDDASKAQLTSSLQFDKERELTRKKYVASLENRTPEQIAEEEALYIEIKRLEQNERRFKKDREDLLRTLLGIESGLPDIPVDDDGPLGAAIDTKKKRKGTAGLEPDSPLASPSNIISLSAAPLKKAPSAKSLAYDALHCIQRTDVAPTTTPATKAAHQPVYLRSFKLPVPKATMAPKITQALSELGISHTRLVMPTRENCAQLEGLFDAAAALVETKKVVDRVEQEIRVLKARLSEREGGTEGNADGMDVDEDADGEADADADADADGEQDTEGGTRAQSVVSTRSTRSRKHRKRSISISSTDTSATVATRSGMKRQKHS